MGVRGLFLSSSCLCFVRIRPAFVRRPLIGCIPGSSTAGLPPSYSSFVGDSSLIIQFKFAAVGAKLLRMGDFLY